jgi:hypothetical protein
MIVSRMMINRIDADLFITQCENGQIGVNTRAKKALIPMKLSFY